MISSMYHREFVDLIVEYHSPGQYLQRGGNGTTSGFSHPRQTPRS